jgi:hypothetical protein
LAAAHTGSKAKISATTIAFIARAPAEDDSLREALHRRVATPAGSQRFIEINRLLWRPYG